MLSKEFIFKKVREEAIVYFNLSIKASTPQESCQYMLDGANIIRFAETLGVIDKETAEAWLHEYAIKSAKMFLDNRIDNIIVREGK